MMRRLTSRFCQSSRQFNHIKTLLCSPRGLPGYWLAACCLGVHVSRVKGYMCHVLLRAAQIQGGVMGVSVKSTVTCKHYA